MFGLTTFFGRANTSESQLSWNSDVFMAKERDRSKYRDKWLSEGKCVSCGLPNDRELKRCSKCYAATRAWHLLNPEATKQYQVEFRKRAKEKVYDHYGRQCACCGESRREFLTIDHINNDGAEQRRKIGKIRNFYVWLVRHGLPDGELQILCWNCNCAKGVYGSCPHTW